MKSAETVYHFGDFALDPSNRLLTRAGAPVELGGRYLDALIMLVAARGGLVTKDDLHAGAWSGVPVTDEALTQAIRALRKALGDDAARPRFIETVPRHGYRFIAPLADAAAPAPRQAAGNAGWRMIGGGALGAGIAGAAIGLGYGIIAATGAPGRGLSLVLVLICLSVLAAVVSAIGIAGGIAGGIALAARGQRRGVTAYIFGGMAGGLVMGGAARLIGLDAFGLLFGTAPADMTGASEGALMGAAAGAALWLSRHGIAAGLVRTIAPAATLGGAAGVAATLAGGRLMGGSLLALAQGFPGSRLDLAPALGWLGGAGLPLAGLAEGAVFTAGLVAGMRALRTPDEPDGRD